MAVPENVRVGNPGFRQYDYRVTWKGDTVIKIEPQGNEEPTGYSDFEKGQVPVYFGEKGPGPLYQRARMKADAQRDKITVNEQAVSMQEDLVYIAVSTQEEADIVLYPDSGKYGVWSGKGGDPRSPDSFRVIAREETAVDYWDGESD